MQLLFRFAYLYIFIALMALFLLILLFKRYWQKKTVYKYPLVSFFIKNVSRMSQTPAWIIYGLRFVSIFLLIVLVAKPQLIDEKSQVKVDGIDIVVDLDVSASMLFFDDLSDRRARIDIAKQEAVRFIKKRINDSIGLVNFGKYALTRCPLTQDKKMLVSAIEKIEINTADSMSQGTMLGQSIVTSAQRLQRSKAKSKVIILLTDGTPTPGDLSIQEALSIAKSFDIKIYTIGVGSDGGYTYNALGGISRAPTMWRKDYLIHIAKQTGGKFFEAKKAQDLVKIYDEIDALETTSYDADVYTSYIDYFIPIVCIILLLLLLELCITTFVWTII